MIELGEKNEFCPLTSIQMGMLSHSLRPGNSGTYVQQLVISLTEPLFFEAWLSAWNQLVERHDILRSSFDIERAEQPLLCIHSGARGIFEAHDWQGIARESREERFEAFLASDRDKGFDFQDSLPWRWQVLKLGEHDSRMVWTSHHALFDGRTRLNLIKELFLLYDASLEGNTIKLNQPRSIAHYLRWIENHEDEMAHGYWTDLLQGFDQPTPLPGRAFSRSISENRVSPQRVSLKLPEAFEDDLLMFTADNAISPNTLLQGAWALALGYLSGQSEVVFGATRACRKIPIEGADEIAGLLINTLPIRVRVSGDEILSEWLKELRRMWVELRDYELTSLSKIHRWSEVPPGKALFESIVVFENYRLEEAVHQTNDAWKSRRLELHGTTEYPLVVAASLGHSLAINVTFDRKQFADDMIARVCDCLQTVLQNMVRNPHQRVADIPLLNPAEQKQIACEWNQTARPYPQASIIDLFKKQVRLRLHEVAMIADDYQWTYEKLDRMSNGLAHRLKEFGVSHDTPVAICVDRSPELVLGLLAILKAGGTYVTLDPAYPMERIDRILDDTGAFILLRKPGEARSLTSRKVKSVILDLNSLSNDPLLETSLECSSSPDSPACIMYTSGSTGVPKGVVVPHGAVSSLVFDSSYAKLEGGHRIACVSSVAFDAATFEIWGALLCGGTCVIVPGHIPSLDLLEHALSHHKVDTLFLTTALFNTVIDERPTLLSGITQLLFGGEPHSLKHVRRACAVLPDTSIVHVYGPTEATTFSTYYQIPKQAVGQLERIPIGKPVGNTFVYITDELGRLVPPGVAGELLIGGAGLAKGYLNQPQLTEERFLQNTFGVESGSRLFRTKDLARYLPDGNIEFLGRLDDQVKIRGFRVEPAEVEAVLEEHPAVRQATVVAQHLSRPLRLSLVAYVVPHTKDLKSQMVDFRAYLESRLPLPMIPSYFVTLEALPLTRNGKLDRKRLPPVQLEQATPTQESRTAPRTQCEKQLVDLFSELLDCESVGVEENLTALGVDSLLAIRAVARLRGRTGKELRVSEFFQLGTIAKLAAKLECMPEWG